MTIKTVLDVLPSLLVLIIGFKINKMDSVRRKQDAEIAEYFYNITNCLLATVDSVAELANEGIKEVLEETACDKTAKKNMYKTIEKLHHARKDLASFQQKITAEYIARR